MRGKHRSALWGAVKRTFGANGATARPEWPGGNGATARPEPPGVKAVDGREAAVASGEETLLSAERVGGAS